MLLRFTKFKFSTSFFYRKVNNFTVEINDSKISVSVPPYLVYCGQYTLISKLSSDFEKETFLAVQSTDSYILDDDPDLSIAKYCNLDRYIVIYKGYRKIIVVDRNKDGVILKN
jgi:hypothetical protein